MELILTHCTIKTTNLIKGEDAYAYRKKTGRDLNVLHQKGVLVKVFGGAVRKESRINLKEEVSLRKEQLRDEKIRIAGMPLP